MFYMWVPVTSLSMLMSLSLCVCVWAYVCVCLSVSLFSAATGAFACMREGSLDFYEIYFMLGASVVL